MPACVSEAACLTRVSLTRPSDKDAQQQQQQQSPQPAEPPAPLHRLHLPATLARLALLPLLLWLRLLRQLLRLFVLRPVRRLTRRGKQQQQQQQQEKEHRHCVLLGGGSSLEAVRMARNLARVGARVVVCEFADEGGPAIMGPPRRRHLRRPPSPLPCLARYSRACASFYRLPPVSTAAAYASALLRLVERERVCAYVPLAARAAFLDALAKPYLEAVRGVGGAGCCACFHPDAAALALLTEPRTLPRRARAVGLAARAEEEEEEEVDAVPPPGGRLPRRGARQQPAARLEYLACATLRDSRLLAVAVCRAGDWAPVRSRPVERWLGRYFSRGWPLGGGLSGHFGFRLAARGGEGDGVVEEEEELVGLECWPGPGPAYLGQSPELARLLCRGRDCGWQRGQGDRSSDDERTKELQEELTTMDSELLGRPLDARAVLWRSWDPLPYCAYLVHGWLPKRGLRLRELPRLLLNALMRMGMARPRHRPPLGVVG